MKIFQTDQGKQFSDELYNKQMPPESDLKLL